ncbi:MAG: class I SAM-dependent methyltransferase [Phycisphaerae bacterium]|nr:class I SAM-dependent methyltransferase [Phycisphaerae bacterium]
MQSVDRRRFAQMAEDYDQMAPFLVPMYEFLQQEMIRQVDLVSLAGPRVIDLGAGSGRLLERMLTVCPRASCYWVDSSEAFLATARRRLARFGGQVTYVLSPMEEDWVSRVSAPVDVIFSMSAIHHLEPDEKRAVYARSFDLLAEGGWLLNTDEMKGLDLDAYLGSLNVWVRYVDEQMPHVPPELQGHARQWGEHFRNWRRRNVERFDRPKTKGDDLHEPFMDQVRWLKEIGYVNADVFVKYHLWCMVGGRKPWKVPARQRDCRPMQAVPL